MVNSGVCIESRQVSTDKSNDKPTNQNVSKKRKSIMIGGWPYQSQSTTQTTYDGRDLKRQKKKEGGKRRRKGHDDD